MDNLETLPMDMEINPAALTTEEDQIMHAKTMTLDETHVAPPEAEGRLPAHQLLPRLVPITSLTRVPRRVTPQSHQRMEFLRSVALVRFWTACFPLPLPSSAHLTKAVAKAAARAVAKVAVAKGESLWLMKLVGMLGMMGMMMS